MTDFYRGFATAAACAILLALLARSAQMYYESEIGLRRAREECLREVARAREVVVNMWHQLGATPPVENWPTCEAP